MKMELTKAGREILGDRNGVFQVRYQNGPIMSPMGVKGLGAFRTLAIFRSEVARYDPQKGTMVNTPAIIAGSMAKAVCCQSARIRSHRLNCIRWWPTASAGRAALRVNLRKQHRKADMPEGMPRRVRAIHRQYRGRRRQPFHVVIHPECPPNPMCCLHTARKKG